MEDAFHGRTIATVTAPRNEKYRAPFAPLRRGVRPRAVQRRRAIEKAATRARRAAVLLEPIQGEGGVNMPDDDYLPRLRQWCDEAGILLLLDEVQTGVGPHRQDVRATSTTASSRTRWPSQRRWAAAFRSAHSWRRTTAASLRPGEHGTTFGGNALACEVGYTVLKYMLDHDLPAQVAKKGEYFERKLHSLADRHPMVTEVRGKGLIWAIELDRPVAEEAMQMCSGARAARQQRQADGAALHPAATRLAKTRSTGRWRSWSACSSGGDRQKQEACRSAMPEKIVLAYSGGLDTSVAIRWLKEDRGYDVSP